MTNGVLELLQQSPPLQFQALESLLGTLTQSTFVEAAFVRGSIARNDYDRASDVDLILIVEDHCFVDLANSLDDILKQHFSVLLPGWHDLIVPNFGGVGFVYLLKFQDTIVQADLYLLPSSRKKNISHLKSCQSVYQKEHPAATCSPETRERINQYLGSLATSRPTVHSQITELFIVSNLIKKRIARNQRFLNYSETQLLYSCIRNIMRLLFDPSFVDYGWYHFSENLKSDPQSRSWLIKFEDLIFSSSILSAEALFERLAFGIDLIRSVKPDELKGLEKALQFLSTTIDPAGDGIPGLGDCNA